MNLYRKDRKWIIGVIERLLHKMTIRDLDLMYTFAISLLGYADRRKAEESATPPREVI